MARVSCTLQVLRTGIDLYVWVPMPGEARNEVEIPSASLIWKDGLPWFYMKIASDTFRRYAAENALDQGDRWFVPGNSNGNAEIVVSGGQSLLSRKFHWQIPDEDNE